MPGWGDGVGPATGVSGPTAGGGDIWGDILPLLVDVGLPLLGGYMQGQAGKQAYDAQQQGVNGALDLQRYMFNRQDQLFGPDYLGRGNAVNTLNRMYNLPQQNYAAAYGGQYGGGMSGGGGGGASNNWGAGQPVQGHSGGGGSNALAGAAGSIGGFMLGGPIGSAIGGTLGGMIRNGGDNWQTLGTSAPEGYDFNGYFSANPDLSAEWAKKDVQSLFNGNKDAYAWWHYNNMGKNEGRQLTQTGGGGASNTMMPGGQLEGSGQNALTNPMSAFWASPDGQITNDSWAGVDGVGGQARALEANWASKGKVGSGAAAAARQSGMVQNLSNGFNNYRGGIERLAGLGSGASGQIANAGQNYAANAGNLMQQQGTAKGNGLNALNGGYMAGISGAIDGFSKFAKTNGWTA